MLSNFLDLVSAVVLAGLLELSEETIVLYETFMRRYLEGVKQLYPDGVIKPNHHYALHLPDYMRIFAAVHSWRSFGFERANFTFQTMPSNLKFGQCSFHRSTTMCLICLCRRDGVDLHDNTLSRRQSSDGVTR